MGFKCGIVGLPNVGKSTLFNALTKANIESANYPFCTIEPNVGIVPVADPRLDQLANIAKPQTIIPAAMQFVDIAGLVAGASQGQGLGNKFLSHIREVDAIAQVVRCFDDENIVHVQGKVDPISDIETINTELMLADLETVDKALVKMKKANTKESQQTKVLFEKLQQHLADGHMLHTLDLDEEEFTVVKQWQLLTAKPMFYIANVAESGFDNNPLLDQLTTKMQGQYIVVICTAFEAEIAELSDVERREFIESMGWQESGLNKVIRTGYDLLGLHTYFTAGEKEVRAWTIPKGATAPQAAGKIHTDFERGFIRASVIAYQDFINHKGEQGAKAAGKVRLEGKDYVVADGDVIHFLFNV